MDCAAAGTKLVTTWSDADEDAVHVDAHRALAAGLAPHALGRTFVNFAGEPGGARAA